MKADVTFVTLAHAFWMAFPHKRSHNGAAKSALHPLSMGPWNIKRHYTVVSRMLQHSLGPTVLRVPREDHTQFILARSDGLKCDKLAKCAAMSVVLRVPRTWQLKD